MKIALAQIRPEKGDIEKNIEIHLKAVDKAAHKSCQAIFFPELSITSYEPELAKDLAFKRADTRLNVFQEKSDHYKMTIGVGVPLYAENGIYISMLVFQPQKEIQVYRKQRLHKDEIPFFEEGIEQLIIEIGEEKIAPAICYESLQEDHLKHCKALGATIYLASVVKSEKGVQKAIEYFSKQSKAYEIPILMVNALGYCDNFLAYGNTSVWNREGSQIGSLNADTPRLLLFDTVSGEIFF